MIPFEIWNQNQSNNFLDYNNDLTEVRKEAWNAAIHNKIENPRIDYVNAGKFLKENIDNVKLENNIKQFIGGTNLNNQEIDLFLYYVKVQFDLILATAKLKSIIHKKE